MGTTIEASRLVDFDGHPGGTAPIMAHTGKVQVDTFHDDHAEHILNNKIASPHYLVLSSVLTGSLQDACWTWSPRRQ
jgi:cytochrome b involved in lipid metabolism